LIDVLMRMHRQHPALGFDARAFEASERARARALLELLGESQSRILEGIDPGLLDREERTRAALAGRLDAPGSALESRLAEYRKVQNEIRASSPRYAALTQPQPGGLDDIRRDVLDGETTLVEYALGEERSYVWVITQRAIAGHELAPRSVIEAAARRAYDALAGPNSPESREPLSVLSRLVLQPIAGGVTTRRVAIVTEGALQYIPFATLPDASGRPLVAANEIVSLPSASTLQVLRREFTSRPPASQALFVVGDPVFDGHDSRVRAPEAVPKAGAGAVERSARESGVNQLERLYFTRREADSIASLGRRGQTRELVDFDANLDRLMETEVSAYRFVHLATHGLLNNRHPELSGLVFSLVDRQGRPRNGFLPASDVYNLRLNADLVVLSACQTALGGDVRGEGLVGLTRAFMYAGAPRVVSSLWRVPDNATAVLMQQFYRRMLVDHAQPAAALRAAQLAVRSEPRWSAPYYWAGFILQGEWR
jgi:CHAT domain-containing protein